MAVNVLGGSLEFDAVLTTDGLDAGTAAIKAEIQDLITQYQKLAAAGDPIGDGFKDASEEAKLFGALMVHLSQQTGKAFDAKDVNKYAAAIDLANQSIAPLLSTLAQNVGADKINELATSLEKVNDDGKALQITLKFIKDNIGALNLDPQGAQALNSAILQLENTFGGLSTQTDNFSAKTKSAFSQLRDLKNDLVNTDKDDPAFGKELEEAEKLENKIKNVNKTLELTGKNTAGLAALTEATKAVIGGFEAWNGVLGLIADSDEQVEKTIKNVVSAMGVLNGIQEISAVLDKRSELNLFLMEQLRRLTAKSTEEQAIATELLAGAQETEAVATEGAVVAQEELNVAMEANPAGILLLAITGLVIALQAFASSHKDATEEQIKANEAYAEGAEILEKLAELQADAFKDRATEANDAVSLAQAQGKSEQDILNLKLLALKADQQSGIYQLAFLGYSKQEYGIMQAQMENLLEQQHAVLSLKNSGEELSKDDQKRLDLINAQIKALDAQLSPIKKLVESNKAIDAQIEENRATSEKKQRDDALKSAQATADAKLIIAKKNTQAEQDAAIEAIKRRRAVELNDPNLTDGEIDDINAKADHDIEEARRKFRVAQLNDTKSIIQAQLDGVKEGTEKELNLRIALAENAGAIELEQEGITAAKRIEIAASTNKKITDLTKQFALQNAQADVETRIAGIDTELAAVQKGTEKELQLKKDRIDQVAALNILSTQNQEKNEQLLAAKILEINAKASADKKRIDDEYADHLLQSDLRIIQSQTDRKNISLQSIINDPFSSTSQKNNAESQQVAEDISGLIKQRERIQQDVDQGRGDINKLNVALESVDKAIDGEYAKLDQLAKQQRLDRFKKLAQGLSAVGGALGQMGATLQSVNPEIAELISKLSSVAEVASKAVSSFTSFSSGDIVGGISSAIGAISGIFSLFGGQPALTAEQVQQIKNQALIGEIEITQQYQQRLLDQAKLNRLRIQGIQEETNLLQQQAKTTQQQFNDLLAEIQKMQGQRFVKLDIGPLDIGTFQKFSLAGLSFDQLNELFLKGELTDSAKELFQELQKLKDAGADITKALADAKDQLDQTFTGTTADDITDSIVDGFKNGLHSAQDFAGTFEDLMKQAMLNALKYQVLQGPLQQFYDQFALDAESDSVLTQGEVDSLKKSFDDIINNADQRFKDLQAITNINFGDAGGSGNNLAGAIRGITEQQAELLAGQFGGLRVTAIEQLNMATRHLQVLQSIESNTSSIPEMRSILRRMELNGIKFQ